MDEYYARIAEDGRRQTVREHLDGVARLSAGFAEAFAAEKWGRLAGRWHDLGKFSLEFQKRIGVELDADAHIEQRSGKPDHSTAGAQHAVHALPMGKILAYAIAGHHGGLPNGADPGGSCLLTRLKKTVPDWSACPPDLLSAENPGPPPFELNKERLGIQGSFFIRMLYSCLVDADFLDTERFIDPVKAEWRAGYPALADLNETLDMALQNLAEKAARMDPPLEINRHRADILAACQDAAKKRPGLFTLTVPTGGGKTLSSLSFALRHALKHGMKRIIYVIPYTSIIEQNAAVFRDILGEAAVLEHHSTFDFQDEKEEDHRNRLASENWDAPLVVTTNVQFFESLFHNRSSKCRKLHRIANSVVILDEAQMLPVPFLRPCIEALRELTEAYRSTVVLCTATQPALSSEQFQWGLDIPKEREMMPDSDSLYAHFQRVEAGFIGTKADEEIAARLREERQVLCVVNTRGHARKLYEMLEEENAFHLSAMMCPAHRTKKLKEIRAALENGEPCRVVSTQLVEAGVDIDFPVVYRAAAGIDSIAQAAGRCNREGRLDRGTVHVFVPESVRPPVEFRLNVETAEIVMRHHDDILSPASVREYFESLFWRKGDAELDREGILRDLFEGRIKGDFPFKDIAGKFRFIKDGQEPIIVPYDEEAERLIEELRYTPHPASTARKLQRYTVQVWPYQMRELEMGAVETIQGCFRVLINSDIYHPSMGLQPEDPSHHEPENLVI
ncbi:MAG: CRISPR-associated helicase Cas3' [Desulfococcaceae bacterium]